MHVFSWNDTLNQQKISYILFGNTTILFLFISGYLFQHLSKKFNTKKYYLSKLNYVLLPYFVISLPVVIYYVFINPPGSVDANFLEKPRWLQFVSYYWYGNHAPHFWFIPVIALFYLVGPILIWGDKKSILYKLLPLFVILSLLINRSTFPTYNFIHFFSIYVLGMVCSKYKFSINPLLSTYKMLFLLTILFLSIVLIEYFKLIPEFVTINYLQKIFLIFLLLGILIKFERYVNSSLINIVANTSFGIYFLHGYVLYCVYYMSQKIQNAFNSSANLIEGSILNLLLISFITVLISTLFVLAIKYVMGDKTHILIGNIPDLKKSPK